MTVRVSGGRSFVFTANSVGDVHALLAALRPAPPTPATSCFQSAYQRWWLSAFLGIILAASGIGFFAALAAAESGTATEPVKLHWLVYLLYQAEASGSRCGCCSRPVRSFWRRASGGR